MQSGFAGQDGNSRFTGCIEELFQNVAAPPDLWSEPIGLDPTLDYFRFCMYASL